MDPRRERLLAIKAAGVRALPRGAASARPRAAPTAPAPAIAAPSGAHSAAPARDYSGGKGCGSPELLAIRTEIGECERCGLCRGRTRLVFGVGDARAKILFVGEGPGADEDAQGEPFVGRAGQLLTKVIQAMGLSRETVYIANVVKCRPPENRKPEADEMTACRPFLFQQIAAIKPRAIVALGGTAMEGLTGEREIRITRRRGQWFELEGIPVMPTYHPSYILRNGGDTLRSDVGRQFWEDMKTVLAKVDGR